MHQQLRQFYSYLGPRWGGGESVHLEFHSEIGLPLHVESVKDNEPIPAWILEKMTTDQLAEVQTLLGLSKPRREEGEALMAALIASESAGGD